MEGRRHLAPSMAVAADMVAAQASARVAGTAAVADRFVLRAVGLAGMAVGTPVAVELEAVPKAPYRQRQLQSDSV